jgi:rubrerythrin
MKRIRSARLWGAVLIVGVIALAWGLPAVAQPQEQPAKPEQKVQPAKATVLDNLMTAYNGESNAHARYEAFAKKADEEGHGPVASLFRAAARSEQVHVNNHAEVIKKMGGTPKADIKPPEVKSTKENLQAALAGETYERDTMYPDFLKLAKAKGNKDAVRTFNFSLQAETQHAKLYKEALDNLDHWKGAKKDFFVCPTCGYTVEKITFEKCPVCSTPKDKYEKIS